jgi:hypothetical protein
MKPTSLVFAAILLSSGAAFAGSDHYGSENANRPAPVIDPAPTASILKMNKQPDQNATPATMTNPRPSQDDYGQGNWGNR